MCHGGALPQVPRWQILEDPGFNALLDHTLRKLRSRMTPRQLANGVRALACGCCTMGLGVSMPPRQLANGVRALAAFGAAQVGSLISMTPRQLANGVRVLLAPVNAVQTVGWGAIVPAHDYVIVYIATGAQ